MCNLRENPNPEMEYKMQKYVSFIYYFAVKFLWKNISDTQKSR